MKFDYQLNMNYIKTFLCELQDEFDRNGEEERPDSGAVVEFCEALRPDRLQA